MTNAFENMLYLLGSGARGYEVSLQDVDIDSVRKCAISQGVWPIVYKALEKTHDVSKYRMEFIAIISKYVLRKDFSLKMIRELEKNGIKCCIIKGPVVARFYHMPDCRISGDIDVYINSDDENKAADILRENGYRVEPRTKNGHHFLAVHNIGGPLEVHVSMSEKTAEDIAFDGKISYSNAFKTATIDENEYNIMNENDELIQLTTHCIKHFVSSGCGIRQVLDMLLCMEKNKENIDLDWYNQLFKELRYDKFIEVAKSIGAIYFGYDYPVCHKELIDKVLTDMENGGSFGYEADDRVDFFKIYCNERAKSQNLNSKIHMKKRAIRVMFFKLFPTKKGLIACGYSYAGHSLLVPFAYIHRLMDLLFKSKKKINEIKTSGDKAHRRLDIMKELGMID